MLINFKYFQKPIDKVGFTRYTNTNLLGRYKKKGDYGYETAYQYRYYYDDGNVHDLLRPSFRCTLRFKSKPLLRLNFLAE